MRSNAFRVACVVLVVAAFSTVPPMARAEGSGSGFAVVRIEVADSAEVALLEELIDVWAYHDHKGIVDAAVDAEGERALRELGFPYEVDEELTDKYSRPAERLKDQTEGIPGYPCYRTVEETLADGAALAAAYPDLADWIDIGDSWERFAFGGSYGYDLIVLRLTNETNGIPSADKPKLWVNGGIHAREYTTPETVTRFAEHLLAGYDVDPDVTWLLDHHEVHLLLQTNPDGRKKAESGLSWRKNTNQNYCGATSNDRGADLNRNFDFEWGCCGGSSSNPCYDTYRGPSEASEPETQAFQSWVAASFPDWRPDDLTTPAPDHATGIFIDVHSYGGDVLTAFGFQDPPPPNNTQFLRLGRKFSYFTGYYARLGSIYSVDGATKDWGYGRMGMPSYTFELGTDFFQDCASFESTIYPDNLQVLLYAARAVRAPYTQSSGPEVVAPAALPSAPAPGGTVTVTAILDDTRFGPGESSPPMSVETIADAELYVDVPPWQAGAVAIPMAPADGAFDSSVETVTGSFGSSGLGDGRHTVYIRGRDSAGYWGTVRAVWVWVLDPATAAHVAGTVTEAGTGAPLGGTVTAGAFSTASSPADGSYDLLLPAGTYDVTASAPGHHPQAAAGVVASQGSTTPQSFALDPFARSFADDVEGGNIGWVADAPWAIVSNLSHSPTHAWHESPGGNSPHGVNVALESPPLDLRNVNGASLSFWHRYAIENNYDYGRVEWSADGGLSWHTAATYTGTLSSWTRVEVALPGLEGAADARVRFRFTSDSNTSYDGWYVDDISLDGVFEVPLFSDGFESGTTGGWSSVLP
ncbi:MAG TPA: M14 family zinc carboxypeptidase [Candidatus Sulfomarinibacteraceae bacterium]|nr:M14 family zinc carboxypeptidase [Candidatus Sulfomarinibacteraceae bacterium]